LTWLSNVVQFVKLMGGSRPGHPGELHPDAQLNAAPPADTRRVSDAPCGTSELCLHVLSSFQRTGFRAPPDPPQISSSGEPYELTVTTISCQQLFFDASGLSQLLQLLSRRPEFHRAGQTEKDQLGVPSAQKNCSWRSNWSGHARPGRALRKPTIRRGSAQCQPRHRTSRRRKLRRNPPPAGDHRRTRIPVP
jgi:hypothetical protein